MYRGAAKAFSGAKATSAAAAPQNRSHAFWERKSNGGVIDRDIYVAFVRLSILPLALISSWEGGGLEEKQRRAH